jgi:hypothetical protein
MTRPLPLHRTPEGLAPRSAALAALLDALNPRLLDMLVPEGRHDDGRAYFAALGRLSFRREESEYEVRSTDDNRFRVTVEGPEGPRELLLTDSLHALELFILVDDLVEADRRQLFAWLAERRLSPERVDGFEHRWTDGSSMRADRTVGYLPELVEEFGDKQLVDVMEVVEHLRQSV